MAGHDPGRPPVDFFRGRTLLIATMHGKEEVIAPLLERELGVRCVTPRGYDTDRFGSFSGEVKRPDTALNTARAKALGALAQEGGTLAVASEGSFEFAIGSAPLADAAVAAAGKESGAIR